MQVLPFNECGGHNAYNVYISVTGSDIQNTETTRNTACVAIQCSGDSKYLYENDCNLSYSRICERKGDDDLDNLSWQKSMQKCKFSAFPSYLHGDFSLGNVTQACEIYRDRNVGPSWIGIANQIYFSLDERGIEKNMSTPLRCERCSKKGCRFVQNCLETAEYRCTGVGPTTKNTRSVEFSNKLRNNSTTSVPITEAINTRATPSTSKKETTTKTTTLTNTTFQSKITIQTESSDAGRKTYLNILLPISIIITTLVVLSGAMVIIIRWRRCGKQDIDQIKDQQQGDTNQYAQVDKTWNKKNITLEPQPKNPEHSDGRGMGRTKNSNIEKNEGVYEHLRETNFREEDKEETYDHAGFVVGSGDCDYGTTQSIQRREQESTYDHA